jgi:hypothetical protein
MQSATQTSPSIKREETNAVFGRVPHTNNIRRESRNRLIINGKFLIK